MTQARKFVDSAKRGELALVGDASERRITLVGNRFALSFPIDRRMQALVATIPGAHVERKRWVAPATAADVLLSFAEQHGFAFDEGAHLLAVRSAAEVRTRAAASAALDAELEVPGLGGVLRPSQRAGVAYALRSKRLIFGDDMGLGKTVEALATLQSVGAFPAVVVCPALVKLNWLHEIVSWLPDRTATLLGHDRALAFRSKFDQRMHYVRPNDPGADIAVVGYDVLHKHVAALRARGIAAAIVDEAHYVKTEGARRTKAVADLCAGLPWRLFLTGTPVLNRASELISPLRILDRMEDLGGRAWFEARYCDTDENLPELNRRLRAICYVRRLKRDVMPELPAKQRVDVPIEIDNRREYAEAERDVVEFLRRSKGDDAADAASRAEQLVQIEVLKQVAAKGKLAGARGWVRNYFDAGGEKLVAFASHRDIQHGLLEGHPDAVHLLGDDPAEARQAAVERFQNDSRCQMIVCSLKAGGIGVTLTASSNAVFLEQGWTPADHDQAEDRCYGRVNDPHGLTAYYLLAPDTIDFWIYGLLSAKRAVVAGATDGVPVQATSILAELVKRLTAA